MHLVTIKVLDTNDKIIYMKSMKDSKDFSQFKTIYAFLKY